MQPRLTFLDDADTDRIIDGAMSVLAETGLHIANAKVRDAVASDDGASIDGERVMMSRDLVERSLKTAPSEIAAYRQDSDDPIVLAGDAVHYMAGLVGTYAYDERIKGLRAATTTDLVSHTKAVDVCDHIDFQSGAFIVNDIPKPLFSSYRYYISLLYCAKPPVIGANRGDDLPVIHELLSVMAGGEAELERRPVAIIHINPSSPLALTDIVAENVFYAARHMLPVMLTPIPLAGGSSPVTLAGTLVQHTAENLGSVVVGQCARPGAPAMFGGGPSIMDMRKGTAAMASPEAVMMGVSLGQIARKLGLPSASGVGRADSKRVDYQAGQESGVALVTMALAGINLIRGPGTLEYANVISTEKLLIDNEICGMAKRLVGSIRTSDEALALDVISTMGTTTRGYLAAPHTMKWFRDEVFLPSDLIDRGGRREFEENDSRDAFHRARARMEQMLADYTPRRFDAAKKKELDRIILAHAKQHGADRLPVLEIA